MDIPALRARCNAIFGTREHKKICMTFWKARFATEQPGQIILVRSEELRSFYINERQVITTICILPQDGYAVQSLHLPHSFRNGSFFSVFGYDPLVFHRKLTSFPTTHSELGEELTFSEATDSVDDSFWLLFHYVHRCFYPGDPEVTGVSRVAPPIDLTQPYVRNMAARRIWWAYLRATSNPDYKMCKKRIDAWSKENNEDMQKLKRKRCQE